MKQTMGLLVGAAVPFFMFVIGLFGTMNLQLALLTGFGGIIPAFLIGKGFLRSPMDSLINGKPVCFDLTSSGILQAYEIKLELPLMKVNLPGGRVLETKFDRKLAIPFNLLMKRKLITFNENDEIVFRNEKIDGLMAKQFLLNRHATVFLINSQTGSFITKEQLAKMENTLATENLILYELELVKNMSRDVRQLGKTFMANLGGKGLGDFLSSPWVQAIIIGGILILIAVLIGPMILDAVGMGSQAVSGGLPEVPVLRN